MPKRSQKYKKASPFGRYLRRMRQQAGFTFDQMSQRTGLARGYLADLEYGIKSRLPRHHWGGFTAAGIGITWTALEEMEARSSEVRLDLRGLKEKDLLPVLQLLRWLRAGRLPMEVRRGILES